MSEILERRQDQSRECYKHILTGELEKALNNLKEINRIHEDFLEYKPFTDLSEFILYYDAKRRHLKSHISLSETEKQFTDKLSQLIVKDIVLDYNVLCSMFKELHENLAGGWKEDLEEYDLDDPQVPMNILVFIIKGIKYLK